MFRTVLRLRAPVATLNGVRSAAAMSTTSEAATASANDSFQKWVVGGAVAAAGTAAAYSTTLSHAHGGHGHSHGDAASASAGNKGGISETSGQGDAVFSWDRELTDAFPAGARPFEEGMHGGFNEDSDTGIVYTGIPGY
eukprot:gene25222-22378_t